MTEFLYFKTEFHLSKTLIEIETRGKKYDLRSHRYTLTCISLFIFQFILKDFHSIWFTSCCIHTFQLCMSYSNTNAKLSVWCQSCILCFQYSWKRFDRFCLFKKRKRFDRPRKSYKPRKYHRTVQIKCIEQCFKCMICLKSVFKCSRNAYIHAFAKCFQLIRPKFSLLIFSKIKSTTHSSRKTEIWNDWFSNDEIDLFFFFAFSDICYFL